MELNRSPISVLTKLCTDRQNIVVQFQPDPKRIPMDNSRSPFHSSTQAALYG